MRAEDTPEWDREKERKEHETGEIRELACNGAGDEVLEYEVVRQEYNDGGKTGWMRECTSCGC